MKTVMTFFVAIVSTFIISSVVAEGLQTTKLMALSVVDKRAVIKPAEASLQVVEPGQSLFDNSYHVVQVLEDKLVLRETTTNDIVWLFPSVEGSASKTKRLRTELNKNDFEIMLDRVTEIFEE